MGRDAEREAPGRAGSEQLTQQLAPARYGWRPEPVGSSDSHDEGAEHVRTARTLRPVGLEGDQSRPIRASSFSIASVDVPSVSNVASRSYNGHSSVQERAGLNVSESRADVSDALRESTVEVEVEVLDRRGSRARKVPTLLSASSAGAPPSAPDLSPARSLGDDFHDSDPEAFIFTLPKFPRLIRDEPEESRPEAIEAVAVVDRSRKRLGGPVRIAAHVALLLAIVVIVLGHGYWSGSTTPVHKGGTDTAGDPRNQPIATAVSLADSIGAMNAALPPSTTMTGYLSQPANPVTPVQLNVRTITSKAGDTPSSLAKETGRSVDTILWANGLSDPSKPLDEGSQIQIPPVDGMLHLVRNGDTLQSIAARYDVPVSAITGYAPNNVQANADLVPYRMLMVPGGKLPARDHVITYTVQPGDSLAIVAQYFGLQAKTIAWANNLPKNNLIKPGQNLAILPADGVMVKVNANDTVASLAQEYGVKQTAITNYALNGLGGGGQLRAGQQLMIPGGEPPPPAAPQQQASSGSSTNNTNNSGKPFIWPTNGVITQYFGPTDFWMEPAYDGYAHFHQGLDIANNQGTPIVAAAAGTVIFSGWSTAGLGNCVAIDVGNGLVTWYGHMEQPSALAVGQHVNQGQYIGPMGTTGASSGPHTHFAVTKNGAWVNPLNYLPGR